MLSYIGLWTTTFFGEFSKAYIQLHLHKASILSIIKHLKSI